MDLPTPSPSDHSPESSMNQESLKSEGLEDPLLSPLFLFPGEDTSTGSSSGSSSQHSGSPRHDWALPGPMWGQSSDSKAQAIDDFGSLDLSLNFPPGLSQDQWSSMDMDTDISSLIPDAPQQISIDPNALHFPQAQEQNFEHMFQFTLSHPPDATSEVPPFQLPTPKPGSTSSRSASPAVMPMAEHVPNAGVNPNDLSLLTQLSQKARDASGVMLAVPQGQFSQTQTPVSPVIGDSQVPPSKVPIPRLRPSTSASQKTQFNFAPPSHPTPPASQPSSSPPSVPQEPVPATQPVTTRSGRPKTSHTTIERRYRTNLNARILALRRAVPALRILEKNTANQTQGKGLTGASASKWDFDDVVNERGYVDGVKAAKKNSKGVVLGKAVEYIKALKRREVRLKRETEGLRTLLSGLVGGPELLHEWEQEWHQRFGGEEADEVDEDEAENEDCEADEGDDAEEGDSDEDDGRSRKRTRVEKKAIQGEKRKRGRPRKNPAPDVPASTPHLILQPPGVQDQRQQPSKYLLAAFVFFSFFNPNAPASSSSGKGYQGAVLTHEMPGTGTGVVAESWSLMQAMHVLISVLLLISLVGPYLPKGLTRFLPTSLLFAASPSKPSVSQFIKERPSGAQMSPTQEVTIANAFASGDERALRVALGADGSVYSVAKELALVGLRYMKQVLHLRESTRETTLMRRNEIELRGWRRVAHLTVFQGENSPLLSRIQTYLALSSHLPSSRLPSDSISLALLAHPFAESTAVEHWETARRAENKSSAETLVLDMDIEDAVQVVATTTSLETSEADPCEEPMSLVHHIAAHIVLSRAKVLATQKFVSSVSGASIVDIEGGETPRAQDKIVVSAGRELGGALGTLMSLFDRVERCSTADDLTQFAPFGNEIGTDSNSSDSSSSSESDNNTQSDDMAKDVRVLLLATLLYRRIFPAMDAASAHVPSPPPTPTPKSETAALHLALRRALASAAFDTSAEMEDARDRVVDMLAEARRGRLGARSGIY